VFVLAVGNAAVLAWDLITGGIYFTAFGWVVSSSDIRRPFGAAAVCGALALWLRDRSAATPTWDVIPRWSRAIAAIAAVTSAAIAVHFGVFVAGGSDQYGYVSQAHMWTMGQLVAPDRFAALAPLLGPAPTFRVGASAGTAIARRCDGLWSRTNDSTTPSTC
jgi:hypothetical protein